MMEKLQIKTFVGVGQKEALIGILSRLQILQHSYTISESEPRKDITLEVVKILPDKMEALEKALAKLGYS